MTLGQLATAEQVSPPTMTRLVSAMESDGLVRRSPDGQDRRVAWIAATARGKRLLREGRARRIALLSKALHGVTAKELKMLDEAADFLAGITSSLGQRA